MLKGRNTQVWIITIALLIITLAAGCRSSNNTDPASIEVISKSEDINKHEDINKYIVIPLYNALEIEVSGEWKTVHIADSYIQLDPESDRDTILKHIASELSSRYFNDLKIEIMDQAGENGDAGMIRINLAEMESYTGPGSVKAYSSWYDFFQGSAGGTNTTTTLKESFLQRTYKGEWIESIRFMYMGEPFPESDHVNLSGIITRY